MAREQKIDALLEAMMGYDLHYQKILIDYGYLKKSTFMNIAKGKIELLEEVANRAAYYRGKLMERDLVEDDTFIDLGWEYQEFLRNEAA